MLQTSVTCNNEQGGQSNLIPHANTGHYTNHHYEIYNIMKYEVGCGFAKSEAELVHGPGRKRSEQERNTGLPEGEACIAINSGLLQALTENPFTALGPQQRAL